MKSSTRVWITGAGAVTPLGHEFTTFSENLLAGRSGVTAQKVLPGPADSRQTVAAVGAIPPPPACDASRFAGLNRLEQLSLSCAAQALEHAGLWDVRSVLRIGLVLGLGAEWLHVWELSAFSGGNRIHDPRQDTESVVAVVQRELALDGPAVTAAAACASGNYALAIARRWIQLGWLDLCLAGGCDLISPMGFAGFNNLRALSRRNVAPAAASRPFDCDRDGFVLGEGAALMVLESDASLRRRGARAMAEVAGFGATSDASHMIIPSSDPQPAAKAMRLALADAALEPDGVDYINAHATSTPVGDRAEARALHLAFGSAVSDVPVSSTKSMTGHLLSAAASVEVLACLAAFEHQAIPPTINLDVIDPECGLHHVAHQARQQRVRTAMSNSFGFGGSNTCIVLRRAA